MPAESKFIISVQINNNSDPRLTNNFFEAPSPRSNQFYHDASPRSPLVPLVLNCFTQTNFNSSLSPPSRSTFAQGSDKTECKKGTISSSRKYTRSRVKKMVARRQKSLNRLKSRATRKQRIVRKLTKV